MEEGRKRGREGKKERAKDGRWEEKRERYGRSEEEREGWKRGEKGGFFRSINNASERKRKR